MFKKNYFQVLLMGLAGVLISSCGSSSSSSDDEVEYITVQLEEKGDWSFMDSKGNIKYPDEFKSHPTCVVNGFFSVKEDDSYVLYKASDKPELVKDCDNLAAVGYMREGLIPVVNKESRIRVIDGRGNIVFTLDPIAGKEVATSDVAFFDGLLKIKTEDELYGYVDAEGVVVIKPQYFSANAFSEGKAVVQKGEGDAKKSYVINKKGEVVFELRKDYRFDEELGARFSNGMLVVKDDDHWHFLDDKGEVKFKCPSKVGAVGAYSAKYFTFKQDGNWGVMNFDGETIIRAKYDAINLLEDGTFLCRADEKIVILDKNGDEKYRVDDYQNVRDLGKFLVAKEGYQSYALLDNELKMVKQSEFVDYQVLLAHFSCLTNEYFDVDGVISSVMDLFTDNGVGKYELGEHPNVHLGNPEDYSSKCYKRNTELSDISKSGYRYSINVEAYFSERFVHDSYQSGRRTFYWDEDAYITEFGTFVNCPVVWDSEHNEKLIKAFEMNGYNIEGIVDDVTKYRNLKTTTLRKSGSPNRVEILFQDGRYGVIIGFSKAPEE